MEQCDARIIEMQKITKWHRYGKLIANCVDLKIRSGDTVLLYGREGSGISELYHIVTGLKAPEEGKTIIRGNMAVIPENFPLLLPMDVIEYMLLPLLIQGREREEAWQQVKPYLKGSCLWQKRTVKVQFLDAMEQCVLMMRMAFATKPEVLIIANCTKNLSSEEERRFWTEIELYMEENEPLLLCFSDRYDVPYQFVHRYELLDGVLVEDRR